MCKTTFPTGVVASEAEAEVDMTVFRSGVRRDASRSDRNAPSNLPHHPHYERRAEMDAEFDSYGSETRDDEHVRRQRCQGSCDCPPGAFRFFRV